MHLRSSNVTSSISWSSLIDSMISAEKGGCEACEVSKALINQKGRRQPGTKMVGSQASWRLGKGQACQRLSNYVRSRDYDMLFDVNRVKKHNRDYA